MHWHTHENDIIFIEYKYIFNKVTTFIYYDFKGDIIMKKKKEFNLRNIYGENALVPVGDTALSFKGIIKMNNIGSFIWNNLENVENEDEIVSMVMDKYNLDIHQARTDVGDFIQYLKNVDII